MKALRGHNAQMVLIRLNPIIRGWSAYYRHCVSARVFNELDYHVWKLTYKWAKWTHPHKGKRWIIPQVLRRVQLRQARPVGVRRPRQRRLPAQVRLDEDHPAHAGQGLGLTRRPGPDQLLGSPAATRDTPARPGQAAATPETAWTLPALRRTCCSTPTRSHSTPTNGNSGSQAVRKATRHQAITLDAAPGTTRRTRRVPSHPHPLPRRQPGGAGSGASTSAALTERLQGLPEPVAWKAGTAGSEGAAAQQCAAATRLEAGVLPAGGGRARDAGWSTPATSSTCPAGPRPTSWMRCGWPGHRAGLLRPRFVPPPRSGSCGI